MSERLKQCGFFEPKTGETKIIFMDEETADAQAGLPQCDPEDWDEPQQQVVWRTSGPVRHLPGTSIESPTSVLKTRVPVETRFVGVRDHATGVNLVIPYNQKIHGHWQDIPDCGLPPAELTRLIEDYEGGVDTHQVTNARKRGASHPTRKAGKLDSHTIKRK